MKNERIVKSKNIEVGRFTQFSGTYDAFRDLISRKEWYVGIEINGKPISASNASQMRKRFLGTHKNKITIDLMETLLAAAGYKVVQPVIWEK